MAKTKPKTMHIKVAMRQLKKTEAGKVLIQYLKGYQSGNIFSADPLEMAKKAAQRDLVNGIIPEGETR